MTQSVITDSHCHLDFPDFDAERSEVIARAQAVGVHRMVTICTRLRLEPQVRALAEAHDPVFYAAGTHPMSAADEPMATAAELIALAQHPKFVGIGETGLDYHYTSETAEVQKQSLKVHIAAAQETGLPLIIHARDADADMAALLTEGYRAKPYTCVMHCFSSGADLAQAALDLGFYLSMSGIAAFPKSQALRDIFASAPLERILVETDSPYLAPPPYRGKRNEPGYSVHTAQIGAEVFGLDYADFAAATERNFERLFAKAASYGAASDGGRVMSGELRFTILGCGSSGGVPRLGGHWGDCDPGNPRNTRRRCSMLIERETPEGVTRVLIDTSPDLRAQLLDAGIGQLDAVVYTHSHADHVHGIDDLRMIVFNMRARLPVWADGDTQQSLYSRFGYAFTQPDDSPYPPILDMHTIKGPFDITGAGGAITLEPFEVNHGSIDALGFRVHGLAYLPDVAEIPAQVWDGPLQGLDCWILDALRRTPHPTHAHLERSLEWIARAAPRRAVLTNMHIDLDYATLEAETPDHITPAYDGMVLRYPL